MAHFLFFKLEPRCDGHSPDYADDHLALNDGRSLRQGSGESSLRKSVENCITKLE
jgi:hypothetical protein